MTDTENKLDHLLTRYVAGTLPLPTQVLVQAHLALKPDNRAFVHGMEAMAGAGLEASTPINLARRQDRLASILASTGVSSSQTSEQDALFPRVLRDFVGFDADNIPWRSKLPGYRECHIGDMDGCDVSLLWIRPGRRMPEHTHGGDEITLILDGAYSDGIGRYGRGDISIADETVDHQPVAEDGRPCICFAIVGGPLKLTGSFVRRIGDIIGF